MIWVGLSWSPPDPLMNYPLYPILVLDELMRDLALPGRVPSKPAPRWGQQELSARLARPDGCESTLQA